MFIAMHQQQQAAIHQLTESDPLRTTMLSRHIKVGAVYPKVDSPWPTNNIIPVYSTTIIRLLAVYSPQRKVYVTTPVIPSSRARTRYSW